MGNWGEEMGNLADKRPEPLTQQDQTAIVQLAQQYDAESIAFMAATDRIDLQQELGPLTVDNLHKHEERLDEMARQRIESLEGAKTKINKDIEEKLERMKAGQESGAGFPVQGTMANKFRSLSKAGGALAEKYKAAKNLGRDAAKEVRDEFLSSEIQETEKVLFEHISYEKVDLTGCRYGCPGKKELPYQPNRRAIHKINV